jgi:HEPN domain-containing protein
MITHKNLKSIAFMRLKEAKVLYKNKLYDGAAYLCGYVVEAALKARICKNLNIKSYPDDGNLKTIFSSHDFDRLLLLSGLSEEISLSNKRNQQLFQNWSLLTAWRPERRYIPKGTHKKEDLKSMFKALEDRKSGFLTWIKKSW